jgi:hypothetical protein
LAIDPTGDGQEQQPKHRHVDHERELISRPRQNGRNPVDPELGHYPVEKFRTLIPSQRSGWIRAESGERNESD